MSSPESDSGSQGPNGLVAEPVRPVTPMDADVVISSSQATLPSTEAPLSPIDPATSFKTELNDDRMSPSAIIPSSLTPPPSSQVPTTNGGGAVVPDFLGAQHSSILSPPITGLNESARRDAAIGAEYAPPSPTRVIEASADELRSMIQASNAEHARLKMETAHYKLQYQLLYIQAGDDAKRAAVEHDSSRRQIEALRMAEHARQAKKELSSVTDSLQAKYYRLQMTYEEQSEENEALQKRLKTAKKLIAQKDAEIGTLAEEKEMILNRLHENREHFQILCSPGGIFHGALTPKTHTTSTPVQYNRTTPRQTPKSAPRAAGDGRPDREPHEAPFEALLKVLSQENNSAPSTPITGHRPAPHRASSKHTRNVQSMSSLPTTPASRPRGEYASLLPSADLVPQSEPPHRYGGSGSGSQSGGPRDSGHHHQNQQHHHTFVPETPPIRGRGQDHGRKSRESTISADDNEALARQALQSVAAAATFRMSQPASQRPHASHSHSQSQPLNLSSSRIHRAGDEEEEVYESQASQAASEMLRRDPRESFDVASSAGGSRDVTPTPAGAEKSARLQGKLFPSAVAKGSGGGSSLLATEKRKFSGGASDAHSHRDALATSPTKRLRLTGLRDNRVGLGIQYGQEA